MSQPRKSDRLNELLGDIDPALIAQAGAVDTPEKLAALKATSADRVPKGEGLLYRFSHSRAAVAAVAVLLAVALLLPAVRLLRIGLTPELPPIDETPTTTTAPWEDGRLKLTSLTYRTDEASAASGTHPSFDLLTYADVDATTETDTETAVGTESETVGELESDTTAEADTEADTTEPVVGENLTVSIMDNTKISSYMGDELIKLRPDSGDHVHCPDVYYNIREDEYVCMSCQVLELIRGSEDYVDAAIRCFIDECLLSYIPLYASGEVDSYYDDYYAALNDSDARALFAARKRLTVKKLGITHYYNDAHQAYVSEQISDYEYPVADIVEYGTDMSLCIFTLCSPRTDVAYGSFLCRLDTGEITRIDGGLTGLDVPNLPQADNLIVTDDYQTLIATVPYFATHLANNQSTGGLFVPVYTEDTIFIFDLTGGGYQQLFVVGGDRTPASAAKVSQGVVYYRAKDGHWYAYLNGVFHTLAGEPSRIVRSSDGALYAVIEEAGAYALYLLDGETTPVQSSADELEGKLDEANLYVVKGNQRIHILSGESVTLWEGEYAAMAASEDGRYMYLYFAGADRILCLDVWSGENGYLTLSDSFVTAVEREENARFCLLLNAEETCLLMTYYVEGQVAFDSASFLENTVFHGTRLEDALEDVVNYYTVNGQKLRFYEKSRAFTVLKLLAVTPYLDAVEQDISSSANNLAICVSVAEQLIEYMDVWSCMAEVPAEVMYELLGDMSEDAFAEYFTLEMRQYSSKYDPKEIAKEYGGRRDYALNGFSRASADWMLAFFCVAETEENAAYLEGLFHEGLDAIVTTDRKVSASDYNALYERLLCEAAETLTGMSYTAFVQSETFIGNLGRVSDQFYLVTNDTAHDVRCGVARDIDTVYLAELLSRLEFVAGEREIVPIAAIAYDVDLESQYSMWMRRTWNDIHLIEVGYGEDGSAYVTIEGYYAAISAEEAEAFKTEAIKD